MCAALAVAAVCGAQSSSLNEVAYNLSSAELQADLGLSASAKADIAKIMQTFDRDEQVVYKNWKQGSEASNQQKLEKLEADYAGKLLAALTPDQRARIQEIALQMEVLPRLGAARLPNRQV